MLLLLLLYFILFFVLQRSNDSLRVSLFLFLFCTRFSLRHFDVADSPQRQEASGDAVVGEAPSPKPCVSQRESPSEWREITAVWETQNHRQCLSFNLLP